MIVLDKPIDIPALIRYVQAGKLCIADVIGYRSDLRVECVMRNSAGEAFMTLAAPDGQRFNTDVGYVSRVTVS